MFKRKNEIKQETQHLGQFRHIGVLRKAEDIANKVLERVEQLSDVSGKEFQRRTKKLKENLKLGKTLDDILVEAYALAHKAITEIYGINLYKVQIMGGYALHKGDVSEMRTGEGKTLTAVMPAYLNALVGRGVHIITVNEYLATRDAFNTGKVLKLLGLSTGSVVTNQNPQERSNNYRKDITYITNSELGFDYLKDNMVKEISQKVQRGFNYAIVDEVDSILIDEARTPLIISGGSFASKEEYIQADIFVKSLKPKDFEFDHQGRQTFLTDTGIVKAEQFFKIKNLYSNINAVIVHRISNALQANHMFKFDVDYTIKDDEIILIDIFTGRLLEGRQFSEGLNQAIEAKEEVKIKPETKTLASITYQNLFRMYTKLSGMSGTATVEEEEFLQIYNMRVLSVPTNKPLSRHDHKDLIFASKTAKDKFVISEIKKIHQKGQPILVGTRAVTDSQNLANKLLDEGLEIEILNAKNHAREADIISKAGKKGAITISTNMAGRGTDIKLEDGVKELGGLFVIGTERHESRRIDDQLRGRSGRQGDIGHSRFYVSLEDEIILRSGMDKFKKWMSSLDESPIESKMVSKSLNISQKRIEGLNYDQRKSIIEYDDVLNNQRIIVYKQRDNILKSKNIKTFLNESIDRWVQFYSMNDKSFTHGKFEGIKFQKLIREELSLTEEELSSKNLNHEHSIEYVKNQLKSYWKIKYKDLENRLDFQTIRFFKDVFINSLDTAWTEHIDKLSKLKSGIRYRQYAQKNPIQIYVFESKEMFENFKQEFIKKAIEIIFTINPEQKAEESNRLQEENTKDLIVN